MTDQQNQASDQPQQEDSAQPTSNQAQPQPAQTQPQPTPNQAQPQPVQAQLQPQGSSGFAIAGMVLGIVAALASFIPIINNGAFLIAIVGLILSIIGLVRARAGKNTGKGIAIAGMVLCIVALVVTLAVQAACSAALDSIGTSSNSSSTAASSAASQTSDGEASTQSAQAPTANSDYAVTIDGAAQAADYSGQPAIIVTFTWQNNSDSTKSFATALYPKCFQNGVELDTAIVASGMDSSGYLADVKPGSSTTVQMAYELQDQSPVNVEVTELISFNKDILAQATFNL